MTARRTTRPARTTRTTNTIVKVARVGGRVEEFLLEEDKTVAAALDLAGITVGSGMRVRVNAAAATTETKLKNGDIVTVSEKVQGGM